jgi:hypothetical protein
MPGRRLCWRSMRLQETALEAVASVRADFGPSVSRASPTRPGCARLRTSPSKSALPAARLHAAAHRAAPSRRLERQRNRLPGKAPCTRSGARFGHGRRSRGGGDSKPVLHPGGFHGSPCRGAPTRLGVAEPTEPPLEARPPSGQVSRWGGRATSYSAACVILRAVRRVMGEGQRAVAARCVRAARAAVAVASARGRSPVDLTSPAE